MVRLSLTDEDFAKDRVASGFATRDLPVPRLLELGQALDRYFAISERAPGRPLDELSAAEMRAVLPSLLGALDVIRETDLTGTAGWGRWSRSGDAPSASWSSFLLDVANGPGPTSRIQGWRERLDASPTGSGPFDRAFNHLRELCALLPEVRCLVHADLLNRNVLVSGSAVSAVLDWGNAMYGDFLYDVAWLHFWSPWFPQWAGIDFVATARRHFAAVGVDVPDFEVRLRACLVHIGLDGQAYSAFKGRGDEVEATSRRTVGFIEAP
ncbi:MAG: aminoglycoside phosphotransferase family protein [Chloroflexi bacterium]|nr:aminoglycoside phosphotransferase family protein [Chloroflexota bacterium]MDA1002470.1 aminoglycoside phosphotransferase family protein [Chloroflexota bacterium]